MKYEKHDEKIFIKAVGIYLNSKLSLKEVAEKFGINRSTLHSRVRIARMAQQTLKGGANNHEPPKIDKFNNKILTYTPSAKDLQKQPSLINSINQTTLKNSIASYQTSDNTPNKNIFINEKRHIEYDKDGKVKNVIKYDNKNANKLFQHFL